MAWRLADDDPAVTAKMQEIHDYVPTGNIPQQALLRMAKFGVMLDRWIAAKELVARRSSAGPRWKSSTAWCPAL